MEVPKRTIAFDMTTIEGPTVNVTAYKFASIPKEEVPLIREAMKAEAAKYDRELAGTILLSTEGVNIRLSGFADAVAAYKKFLSTYPYFEGIDYKDSMSDRFTLPKFLVRVKNEIISMGVENASPLHEIPAKHLKPKEFKQWYDENKDMVVLDTRNDYEVKLGTFKNAVDLDIKSFRAFPEAVKEKFVDVPKDKPIVMFCTGGVRCEKAAFCLKEQGYTNVHQLEGGIVKYFIEAGPDHWEGECFTYDDRVALTPDMQASKTTKTCFVCRQPVTLEEQQTSDYVPGKSCPNCVNGKTDFRTSPSP